jgi:phosphatidylglycerophosphate synthase
MQKMATREREVMFGNIVLLPIARKSVSAKSSMYVLVGNLLTYIRIPLGVCSVSLVFIGHWLLAAICVALFVVCDIADGRFARAGGVSDTAKRRIGDAVIDKLSVHAWALGVCVQLPEVVWFWLPLLVRDLIQAGVSATLIYRFGLVAAGAWWHRLFSLSLAFWGVFILISGSASMLLSAIAGIIGMLTLLDYSMQCMKISITAKRHRAI